MTANIIHNIRKIMGWCPYVKSKPYKSSQSIYFGNPPINPAGKTADIRPLQSGNVIFPANTSLLTLFFVMAISLFSFRSKYLDYQILIIISVAIYASYYLLVTRTYRSSIRVDETGVHFKYFRLKDITLGYREIKSVKSFKLDSKNYSKKIGILVTAIILILILSVIYKEWTVMILAAPPLLLILPLAMEEKKRYHDMDTQLYIESKTKKCWYELSPYYYSVITDKITADLICAGIERYGGTIK